MSGETNKVIPIEMPEESRTVNQAMTMPQVMQLALEKNASVETLEKMMELQERYEKNEARKAYHRAMSAFRENPPKIEKDKHVNYVSKKTGQMTDYKHATLANVTTLIGIALSKQGLSANWITSQKDKSIIVKCRITHDMGHYEECELSSSPDESGGKNSIQAIGSAVTYLERYTLLALAGLATHDQDDDGAASEADHITEEQIMTINDWLVSTDSDLKKFCQYMGVKTIDKIKPGDYKKAISLFKQKEKKGKTNDKNK